MICHSRDISIDKYSAVFDEVTPSLTVAKVTDDNHVSENQSWVEAFKKDLVLITPNVTHHLNP